MPLQVDPRSATPIYDQISTQVKHAVAAGTLGNGDSLPSVRKLAIALRVNPNTVARAYRELEAEAVVVTRRGQGTFVASGAKKLSAGARRRALGPGLERLVADEGRVCIDLQHLNGLSHRLMNLLPNAQTIA